MGLLTQAIAGAIGAAGETGASMLNENYKAGLQSERDKAQAIRDENLARLRQQLSDQSTEKSNGMALSSSYDPDTGRQLTNNEANEYDKDTLVGARAAEQQNTVSPYTVNGLPATYGQVQDAGAANNVAKGLISTVSARGEASDMAANQDGTNGPPIPNNIPGGRPGNMTSDEQSQLADAQADGGVIAYTPEQMLQNKLDNQKEMSDLKYSTLQQNAELRAQTALQVANLNYQHAVDVANIRANQGNASATREAATAVKKAEEERKSANAAVSMLTNADMTDPSNVRLFNKHIIAAGEPEGVKPVPPDKTLKPAVKKGGLISSIFGGGDDEAPSAEAASDTQPSPSLPKGMTQANVDQQALSATMKVYADKTLTPQQQQAKVAAIRARRNQFVGVQ